MICNTIKNALALNVSAAIMSFSVSFSASAQGQLEKGNIGYFDYMMWNQDDTEKITFKTDENSYLFMGKY